MVFDLLVLGGGPAGLILADRAVEAGLRVGLVAGDDAPWVPNYGAWVDEASRLGFEDAIAERWARTEVRLDAGEVLALDRVYGRVDGERLRRGGLGRVRAGGGDVWFERAAAVTHDAEGSTVTTDGGLVLRARLVVDATGHAPAFVEREGAATLVQRAIGWRLRWPGHPFAANTMTFMDFAPLGDDPTHLREPTFLYVMPHGPDEVFLEETSLVTAAGPGFDALTERLRRRVAGLGLADPRPVEVERCLIPMDAPLPRRDQRVVGFGGAASQVHPVSGYLLPTVAAAAPRVVRALIDARRGGLVGDALSAAVWAAVWPEDALLRRELYLFGIRLVARMDLSTQRRFFRAFFHMPRADWTAYLSPDGDTAAVARAMASLFYRVDTRLRLTLMRSGLTLPGALLRAAV